MNTPVKRYSKGMYIRLAFAVAAHMEPDILVVDEVLAVGDAAFQRKCLGKMDEASREGRTVLFVSHNQRAVADLCDWTMQLEKGRIDRMGSTSKVVQEYIEQQAAREQPIAKGHAELEPNPHQAMALRSVTSVPI
jgi:ABC-type polysaccharide/polyol phosphate transport system ATPase subunit